MGVVIAVGHLTCGVGQRISFFQYKLRTGASPADVKFGSHIKLRPSPTAIWQTLVAERSASPVPPVTLIHGGGWPGSLEDVLKSIDFATSPDGL